MLFSTLFLSDSGLRGGAVVQLLRGNHLSALVLVAAPVMAWSLRSRPPLDSGGYAGGNDEV
jgi:hypothetical protein